MTLLNLLSAKRIFAASMAVTIGSLLWSGAQTFIAWHAKSDLEYQMKQRESRLSLGIQSNSDIHEAAKYTLSRGMAVASEFQTVLEETASLTGVKITQFQTGTLVVDYLSAYGSETLDGVGNLSAQATLQGTAKSLFATLGRIREADVPFEIVSMDLARTAVDPSGQAICSMNLTLNLTTKKEAR